HAKKRIKICAISIFCFALIASGYRYLSLSYSGDGTLIYQGNEWLYQVSLGRFLQPVYWLLRGRIVAPFVTGLFATTFFFLSACLISEFLSLNHPLSIISVCAILTTNETISLSNATYLPWTDVYALSLLCICIGVYIDNRYRYGYLISPVFYMFTLALYPSYLTCGAVLLVLSFIVRLLRGERTADVWKRGIRSILSLFLGLLLYALVLNIILSIIGIHASYEYNGVGRLEEITITSFLSNLPQAYLLPVIYLFNPFDRLIIPWHQALIPAPLNLAILALLLVLAISAMRKLTKGAGATLLLLLFILPFAMNFVYLISNGIINGLMIVSFYFFYLMPFLFLEARPGTHTLPVLRGAAGALFCVYLAINVVTANRLAVKRDVEYQSTLSAVTRILEDAGNIPGYVPGVTPVQIVGYLPSSTISMVRDGFEDLNPLQGAKYTYAAAYEISTVWYVQQILGSSMVFPEEPGAWWRRVGSSIDSMPYYPEPGYMQLIDDILVIHF
ncbi:MAG: glucosyltransferase domain-containing protein, partial [Clostridia bacterium]|nr:glucosyltransferase domain-containing protein [Clostridia bacterium]